MDMLAICVFHRFSRVHLNTSVEILFIDRSAFVLKASISLVILIKLFYGILEKSFAL